MHKDIRDLVEKLEAREGVRVEQRGPMYHVFREDEKICSFGKHITHSGSIHAIRVRLEGAGLDAGTTPKAVARAEKRRAEKKLAQSIESPSEPAAVPEAVAQTVPDLRDVPAEAAEKPVTQKPTTKGLILAALAGQDLDGLSLTLSVWETNSDLTENYIRQMARKLCEEKKIRITATGKYQLIPDKKSRPAAKKLDLDQDRVVKAAPLPAEPEDEVEEIVEVAEIDRHEEFRAVTAGIRLTVIAEKNGARLADDGHGGLWACYPVPLTEPSWS